VLYASDVGEVGEQVGGWAKRVVGMWVCVWMAFWVGRSAALQVGAHVGNRERWVGV